MRDNRSKITVSGKVRESSGIGVIQKHVYPRLQEDFDLVELESRDTEAAGGRLMGVLRGMLSWDRTAQGSVCLTSPLPLINPRPLVTIVHDLRWIAEASRIKYLYRRWDLRRVVMNSNSIVCVSETTYNHLIRLHPEAKNKSSWAWLGPGILTEDESYSYNGEPGRFMLIGGDPRKKNELAAQVLAELSKQISVSVTGINVSPQVKEICEEALGADRCHWLQRPDTPSLIREFQRAQFYILLGTGEGFGLPFIESMGTGTVPITVDYDLSKEIIGPAGLLLTTGSVECMAKQILDSTLPTCNELQERYSLFSWSNLADRIRDSLAQAY